MSFSDRKNGAEVTRTPGELIAMVDALLCGTLNEKQMELVEGVAVAGACGVQVDVGVGVAVAQLKPH